VTILAVVVLGTLCQDRLALVDFISFAGRARRLRDGIDLVHPLYPVGYPAALSALTALVGDVLWAGKVLAVAAGALAIAATARMLGPLPALWLLAQGALLQWGRTEGTDMPAAALSLASLAAATERRPGWAGALAGAACLCRYTGLAVVPVALLLAGRPHIFLGAFVATTAPHWATALFTGASVLPDQTENLSIAAGHGTSLLSAETLQRWPRGIMHATMLAARQPATWIGAAGLLFGAGRRDRRAFALLGLATTHLALVGLAFAKPRLVLPATLALAAGAAFLVPRSRPRFGWLLPAAGAPVAIGAVLALWPTTSIDARRAEQGAALAAAEGPFYTSDPWVAVRAGGWLHGGRPLHAAGQAAALTPASVAAAARDQGVTRVMVDRSRVRRTYAGLTPLMDEDNLPGLRLVDRGTDWRLWAVEGVVPAGPPDRVDGDSTEPRP
jgi:hypothetical protein